MRVPSGAVLLGCLFVSGSAPAKGLENDEKGRILGELLSGTRRVVDRDIERIRFGGVPRDLMGRIAQLAVDGPLTGRQNAVYVLTILADKPSGPALVRALGDEDVVVRQTAAQGVGKLKLREGVPQLEKLSRDGSPVVRREALKALGLIGDRGASPAVLTALEDTESEPRLAAILALGEMHETKAIPKLTPLLGYPSESVRLAAVKSLCMLGNADGRKYVEKLLAGAEINERRDGVNLVADVKDRWVQEAFIRLLEDKDAGVRISAAKALSRQGDGRGVQWLVLTAPKVEPEERLRIESAIEEVGVTPQDRKRILAAAKAKR